MEEKNNRNKAWWQPAMIIFFKFSGWIVLPLIAALYLGRWLDRKYNSEPWLFLISVGVAFVVSMIGLVVSVLKDYRRIEREAGKNNNYIENDRKRD